MCGIFGCVIKRESGLAPEAVYSSVVRLYLLSESRGKEASGIAVRAGCETFIHREAKPASHLLATENFNKYLGKILDYHRAGGPDEPVIPAMIGHARLTTNGFQGIATNNQPVSRDGITAVHNGIIVNIDALWEKHARLGRKYEVDSEIIPALLRDFLERGAGIGEAAAKTFAEITGTASAACLFNDYDALLLASNTGSLYLCSNTERTICVFASEKYILRQLTEKTPELAKAFKSFDIKQIKAGTGTIISLRDLGAETFTFDKIGGGSGALRAQVIHKTRDSLERDAEARSSMRRCSKCVLPETFPFIEFDEHGVCNFCRSYKKIVYKGEDALMAAVEPFRGKNGEQDCLVAFSGGRDSSYSLHYIKNVLKLNPIAYTYDWGMVNDLARRNQARITGKLGVEQILVSADIKRKRRNIRKNVEAWLKKPDLGMIPLFMAGDKHFFYYANQLRRRTGIKLFVWAENQLERTNFKVGFCGIPAANSSKRIYKLSGLSKLRMGMHYMSNYLANPAYINSSLLDTFMAFLSYYFISHDYLWFFDYVPWEEEKINKILIGEYDWETSSDTKTTWRIGDGTAAFYNYIYHTAAGFTENDTLRSNQIREGLITREEAMKKIPGENAPRFDSIREYLQLINVDFDEAMSVINSIPRLYGK